ncbi:MAG TPA: AIM24 family protein [Mycobacteriales bacterium]
MTLDIQLVGNAMQMAVCGVRPGQTVYCEAGKFLFSSGRLTPETRLTAPGTESSSGGALSGLMNVAKQAGKRKLAGESLAFQYFTNGGTEPERLGLAGVLPGEMRVLELDGSTAWLAEKDAFVAAESTVTFDIAFSGLRQGLRGGEGFVLERFGGSGSVLVGGAGNFIDLDPADFGGTLKVDTGCIVAFEESVSYSVARVAGLNKQALMNAFLGGEGLSLATLSGKGRVILQSMTMAGLANAIAKNMHRGDDGGDQGEKGFGAIGGLLRGLD